MVYASQTNFNIYISTRSLKDENQQPVTLNNCAELKCPNCQVLNGQSVYPRGKGSRCDGHSHGLKFEVTSASNSLFELL